jgi:hypothetical protein
MRLSSSSAEIATASTSRSVKSAKFFTAVAPLYQFRMILNCYKGWIGVGQTEKFVRVPVAAQQHPFGGGIRGRFAPANLRYGTVADGIRSSS